MAFGPESSNPRERRAYADAMLAKASASGDRDDYTAAKAAVVAAGTSRKSRTAGFASRLMGAAMRNPHTSALVTAARRVIDPSQTPSVVFRQLVEQRRQTPGMQYGREMGGTILRWEYFKPDENESTADVPEHMQRWGGYVLLLWDGCFEAGQHRSWEIPLNEQRTDVDVDAVRMIHPEVSDTMAYFAREATEVWRGDPQLWSSGA
jgi:hypothetical protein